MAQAGELETLESDLANVAGNTHQGACTCKDPDRCTFLLKSELQLCFKDAVGPKLTRGYRQVQVQEVQLWTTEPLKPTDLSENSLWQFFEGQQLQGEEFS